MTSSGTYNYALTNANAVLASFARLQIKRTMIGQEHLADAANEANLLAIEFANKQPNLWTSELQTFSLTEGTATYDLPARTIMVLVCYLRTGSGASQNDRLLFPISTYEYASYPNKNEEGFPSVFWFDRQISPTITFWQVPDASSTYTAELQCVRQIQDINLPSGETPDLPYRFLDAFVAGLAYRLSRSHAPQLEATRKADYDEAWAIAATQDTENVNMSLIPGLSSYSG
jgi:hypothetical protein